MCGIAGLWLSSGTPTEAQINGMIKALQHRGPDGDGVHTENGLSMIHVRLAVIDVNGGHQPLFDERARQHLNCQWPD